MDEGIQQAVEAERQRLCEEYEGRIEELRREIEINDLLYAARAKNRVAVSALLQGSSVEEAKGRIAELKRDGATAFLFESAPLAAPEDGAAIGEESYESALAKMRAQRDCVGAIALKRRAAAEGIFLN